jgi:putative membrane protein
MKVFFKWIACVLALFLAQLILGDTAVYFENFYVLIGAGTLLWLVNLTIKPILKVLSFPITLMTLGLFSFVLSVLMVALTDFLINQLKIQGIFSYILIAVLVSVITSVLNTVKGK